MKRIYNIIGIALMAVAIMSCGGQEKKVLNLLHRSVLHHSLTQSVKKPLPRSGQNCWEV